MIDTQVRSLNQNNSQFINNVEWHDLTKTKFRLWFDLSAAIGWP